MGACADARGACTLRAAIQVADQASSATTINVPAGTYSLTVAGTLAGTAETEFVVEVHEHDTDPSDNNVAVMRAVQQISDLALSGGFPETRATVRAQAARV